MAAARPWCSSLGHRGELQFGKGAEQNNESPSIHQRTGCTLPGANMRDQAPALRRPRRCEYDPSPQEKAQALSGGPRCSLPTPSGGAASGERCSKLREAVLGCNGTSGCRLNRERVRGLWEEAQEAERNAREKRGPSKDRLPDAWMRKHSSVEVVQGGDSNVVATASRMGPLLPDSGPQVASPG